MRKPKKQSNSNNLKPIILLGIFIFILFVASFLYRLTGIIKESKWDGENRFTISINTRDGSKIKSTSFFSIDPQTSSVSILKLNNIPKKQYLDITEIGIPVDAFIVSQEEIDNKNIPSFFTKIFFEKNKKTNLTIIDIARLYLLMSSISGNSIELAEVSWPFDDSKKNITEDLFLDQKILKENLSIQIVNATGESGVGNLFARMISYLGGNVVSVITSDAEKKFSEISYFGERAYTHNKLNSMLRFNLEEMKKEGIADIIVVLGMDYKKSFK